ncbi:MAG: hypothetical protein EAS52_17715 [Parapedobacter sp.]|nr:MAG: hypothetical protein EAS52_17715 [Parapedobacter sp.]
MVFILNRSVHNGFSINASVIPHVFSYEIHSQPVNRLFSKAPQQILKTKLSDTGQQVFDIGQSIIRDTVI